jgi:probable HAF family extracellular repeat protein
MRHVRSLRAPLTAAALVLLAAVAGAGGASHRGQTKYRITHLDSLGGTTSGGIGINDRGWITGYSNLDGDQVQHASLWVGGALVDLGTLGALPELNSAVLWPVKANDGTIVGVSETDELDPLGEEWSCSFFFPAVTGHTCVGFVWRHGEMEPLPTLGGSNGFAAGVNNRGQVVGWAENEVFDESCVEPQQLQFRAVVWGPRKGQLRELAPFPGDSTSAATAINDRGQVVGISGACGTAVGGVSAAHALLWEGSRVTELGNLGALAWVTPMAINNRGEVVGFARVPDPTNFVLRAFYWNRARGMVDLGTLDGHVVSEALGINERGDVVGLSCGAGFAGCRAVSWRDGRILDLNTVVPGYEGHLVFANDINNAGRITGAARDLASGEVLAFRAVPRGKREMEAAAVGAEVADAEAVEAAVRAAAVAEAPMPEPTRRELLRRLGIAGLPFAH